MELHSQLPENLKRTAVDMTQLMDMKSLQIPGVAIYETTVDSFYASLKDLYEKGQSSELDGSVAACTGGVDRSPRLNTELFYMGVQTSKEFTTHQPTNGIWLAGLALAVRDGSISPDKRVIPQGFTSPLKSLFVAMDLESSEITQLYLFMRALSAKAKSEGTEINLDIVVIPGNVQDISEPGRDFEANVLKLD